MPTSTKTPLRRFQWRPDWLVTVVLVVAAGIVVWREKGAADTWIAILVIADLGAEFGFFVCLLGLLCALLQRTVSWADLRRVALFGCAAVSLHLASPVSTTALTKMAAFMAALVFVVFVVPKLLRHRR